jgi:hypothetical protein
VLSDLTLIGNWQRTNGVSTSKVLVNGVLVHVESWYAKWTIWRAVLVHVKLHLKSTVCARSLLRTEHHQDYPLSHKGIHVRFR